MTAFFIASVFTGLLKSSEYTQRVAAVENYIKALIKIKSMIMYRSSDLKSVIDELASDGAYYSELFLKAQKNMKCGQNPKDAAVNAVSTLGRPLKPDDRDILLSMFCDFGKSDISGELDRVNFLIDQLEDRLETAKTEKSQKSRLAFSLGIICGLFVCVIAL